ncbi:iron reductase [Ensifer adhaerens]|uniref:Iron reductase n=1 Tax=Ensifer adhaerens TaxID=106592 RepID=A0A0L8C3P6_ENSAD|nr:siderophore-iron reductase FhuF [Ensifer adhaerens]KOF21521.1 iron reductase [Ensifer adhaerens]
MTAAASEAIMETGGPKALSSAFSGPHAWCNEKMVLSDDLSDGMALPEFFASGAFDRALDTYAEKSGGTDRRAVASMWSLYYFSALTIPYLVARVLDHQVLPVSFARMKVALAEDGLPRAFGVADAGDWQEGDDDDVFATLAPLMGEHLREVVGYLKSTGGIAPKLAWNNALVYIDYALRAAGVEPLHAQAEALIGSRSLPDGSPNPFFDCLRHEEEDGARVCRRKICCLRYLLPGVRSCGSLCALPSQRKQ